MKKNRYFILSIVFTVLTTDILLSSVASNNVIISCAAVANVKNYLVNCIKSSPLNCNPVSTNPVDYDSVTISNLDNDECSGATQVPDCNTSFTMGSTIGKTVSISHPVNYGNDPDIWFKFTATSKIQRISISNMSSNIAGVNFLVAVLEDCNQTNTTLKSVSQYINVSTSLSFDVYDLILNKTYYIYVAGKNISFDICTLSKTETPLPSNDICTMPLNLPTTVAGRCGPFIKVSTLGATTEDDKSYYGTKTVPDVWYKFIAVSNRHTFKLFNIHNLTNANSSVYFFTLYSGCPSANTSNWLLDWGTFDAKFSSINEADVYSPYLDVGKTYYIKVSGTAIGFDMCTEGAPSWSPAPTNDDANNATLLNSNNCQEGTTYGSKDGSVWYKFIATQTMHTLTISNVKNEKGELSSSFYKAELYENSNLQYISTLNIALNTTPGYFRYTIKNLTIGKTYYLKLPTEFEHYFNLYINFNICLDIYDVWNGIANSCQTITNTTLQSNTWNNIADNNGLIAQINPLSQNLSITNASIYVNQGTVRTSISNTAYLDRNYTFNLTTQPTSPVSVRLFFKKTDYDALKASDASITSTSNLQITRVSGGTTSCSSSFSVNNGQTVTELTGTVFEYGNDYYIEFTTSSFSNFFINGFAKSLLPVELTHFKAQNTEGGNLLIWQTATEVNVSHFDIEKSGDGKSFQKIGETKAEGKAATYEYLDKYPLSTTTYYRLKINDLDAQSSYSNIVSVANKKKGMRAKVYPNPFGDNLTIDISLDKKSDLLIEVMDILGRQVFQSKAENTEGSFQLPISLKQVPSGNYFLKISDGQTIIEQKIVKQ